MKKKKLRNASDGEKTNTENVKNPKWNKINMLKQVHSVTLDTPVIAHKSQKNIERIATIATCTILKDFHDLAMTAIIIKGSKLIAYRHWLIQSHKHPKLPPTITIATVSLITNCASSGVATSFVHVYVFAELLLKLPE